MSREWKPGDVAMVTDVRGRIGRAMRGVRGWDFTPSGASLNAYSGEQELIEAHPLLVIDPMRLTWDGRIPSGQEFTEWAESLPAGEFATGVLIIADALRDLPCPIAREPKPEEPTEWLAAVEDVHGDRWTVVGGPTDGDRRWYSPDLNVTRSWADIAAVRVLSEGVPAC